MERSDWTPAVLITATVSLVTAGLVWLVWFSSEPGSGAGDTRPRKLLPAHVVVWTGDVAPGIKGVLGPVWGDTKPDRDHDGLLNDDLGLTGSRALAYYRLLLFNTTQEPRVIELTDGGLVMLPESGGGRIPLRSLAAMAKRGEISLNGSQEFSLRSLGALTTRLEIPAGRYAKLVVPFEGRARIGGVRAVATADGTALERRQMARADFRRLLEDPDESRVKDL